MWNREKEQFKVEQSFLYQVKVNMTIDLFIIYSSIVKTSVTFRLKNLVIYSLRPIEDDPLSFLVCPN